MGIPTFEESRCSLAIEVLQRQGSLSLRVFGSSMLPTLWPGDVTAIQACDFDEARVGDILLLVRESRFCLHRVIHKSAESVVTRGDSMPDRDPAFAPGEVVGKLREIHRSGRAVVPAHRLSGGSWLLGRLFAHSDFCLRVALRLRAGRDKHSALPVGSTVS